MVATRGIRLRWSTSRYRVGRDDGVRIRIWVGTACEVTENIFAYRMLPLNPVTGAQAGTFSHVCSPTDLEEYPEEAPLAGHLPEWFRLPYVDVVLRSRQERDDFLLNVKEDVIRLLATLEKMDVLEPGGDVSYGATCPDESSSSSSPSSSASTSSESLGPVQEITSFSSAAQGRGVGARWTDIGSGAGGDVLGDDDDSANFARVSMAAGQSSQVLTLSGFDFTDLPDDATIVGMEVRVWLRNALAASSSSEGIEEVALGNCDALPPLLPSGIEPPQLTFLSLYHPAGQLGANEASGEALTSSLFEELPFGGDTFLWGLTAWRPVDIKRGEFGINLLVRAPFTSSQTVVELDGGSITVYYR